MSAASTLAGIAAALAIAIGAATAAAQAPPAGGLEIVLRDGVAVHRHTLTCDGAPAGTLPHPAAACAGLRSGVLTRPGAAPDGFPQVCTTAIEGPETLRIAGTLDGQPVDACFGRTDGCRNQDFLAVASALAGGPGRPDALGPRLRLTALHDDVTVRAGRTKGIALRLNRHAELAVEARGADRRPQELHGIVSWTPRRGAVQVVKVRAGGRGPLALRRGRYVLRVTAEDYLGARARAAIRLTVV